MVGQSASELVRGGLASVPAWTADSDWQWGDVEEPVIRPK